MIAVCAAAVTALSAEKLAPIPSPPSFVPPVGKLVFKDGDTLVFLGDSITAQCLYTQYLEDFFYTRFPKTRIHFHNAGTMGDRSADSFERFDADVAAHKPQYVSVLSGMNDGNFTDWQQPDERLVMQIDYLDAVSPRITKIASERWDHLNAVFRRKLFPDLGHLLVVTHHDSEMPHAAWFQLFNFEHREKLVLTKLEEGITLALVKFL